MGHKLVFDLETKKTFEEVGGHDRSQLLGVSVVGVYNYTDDSYKIYREKDLAELEKLMQAAELLIGFNSKHFDNRVLQPYFKNLNLSEIPHLDMLEVIKNELGFRIKLDNLARTTLLKGKSGNGLDAIRYYRLGEWESLEKYCLDDVRVTRSLYEYGKNHGYLYYLESGRPTKVKINWGEGPSVDEIIKTGLAEHRQVKAEYIKTTNGDSGKRIKTTIDIREMIDEKVKVLCHLEHREKTLDVSKIFAAELNGASSAYQQSLI